MAYRHKICPKCGEDKSLDLFHNNRSRPDGKACWCKACLNANNKLYNYGLKGPGQDSPRTVVRYA